VKGLGTIVIAVFVAVTNCSPEHGRNVPNIPGADAPAGAGVGCASSYLAGRSPERLNGKLRPNTTLVCYSAFSLLFSGVTRTPLWSAELLTAGNVRAARQLDREGVFHADPHLANRDRSELWDYRRSGYDRGHMAPSGDMPTRTAQQESFSLANIVPQTAILNRGLWSDVESDVRRLAVRYGRAYVVTGPLFEGAQLDRIGRRVTVPTSVFKAVYVPGLGGGAWVASNGGKPTLRVVNLVQLGELAGVDVFPSLPPAVKASSIAIGAGSSRQHRHHRRIEN